MTGWYAILAAIALKSFLLLGATALVANLMRRHSAATRHTLWMAAFAALLALPLLTVSLPALHAPVAAGIVFEATAPLWSRPGVETSEPGPLGSVMTGNSAGPAETRLQPGRAATLASFVWFAGTALSLAQMALAWLAVMRIRRKACPYPGIFI